MQHQNQIDPSQAAQNALVCQADFNNQTVFTNSIVEAANNAGCEFLFEIPARFFGFEDTRAAAIKLNASNDDDQLAFILCDKETGIIHVLSNDEAPSTVIRFVESYANVLSFLKESKTTSH